MCSIRNCIYTHVPSHPITKRGDTPRLVPLAVGGPQFDKQQKQHSQQRLSPLQLPSAQAAAALSLVLLLMLSLLLYISLADPSLCHVSNQRHRQCAANSACMKHCMQQTTTANAAATYLHTAYSSNINNSHIISSSSVNMRKM
jgi:hypothetical protein